MPSTTTAAPDDAFREENLRTADLDKRDTVMAEEWLDAVPEPTADEHLRNAVLSVLDVEDALRAAGVRSEAVAKLLATLGHLAASVTAANNALPRRARDT